MIQINLLPDVKQEFLRAKRTRNTVISISIIAGLASGALVVVLLIVLGAQAGLDRLADNDIKREYAALQQVDDLSEMLTIQSQLASISEQHKSKTMTSRLFSVMQVVNPTGDNSVQFISASVIPETNTITLDGTARNGFPAVEALRKTIQNTRLEYRLDGEPVEEPLAAHVSVGDTMLAEDADGRRVVRFQITIEGAEVLLNNSTTDMQIRGPERRIDVTDSRLGVPESIFTSAPRESTDE